MRENKNQSIKRTLLNFPLDSDRHLFFAPLCDFNFGKYWTADVENDRVVVISLFKKNILLDAVDVDRCKARWRDQAETEEMNAGKNNFATL